MHAFSPNTPFYSIHRALGRLLGSGMVGFGTVDINSTAADGYGIGRR